MDIFLAGRFVKTNKRLNVINPYNGNIAGRTFLAGKEELEEAIQAALAARRLMQSLSSYQRYDILMHIKTRLQQRHSEFADMIMQESGKPIRYASGEVDRSVQTITVAAEESKRMPREYISLDWTKAGERKEGLVRYFPVGVVAGIAPFNFPLNLAVHKLAPAIAAGCPVILKPSSSTPLSMLLLTEIIAETNLPAGAVSVLPMDRETGNLLVTDERIAMLSFTGSPEVGWKMKAAAGKKKVVLELGGNAGVVITPSADIESALTKCLSGAFSYSGQVCIHTQRIFAHRDIFNVFASRFAEMTSQLKSGEPASLQTDVSCMIDEANAQRVEKWVNDAKAEGARVLAGGKRTDTFYAPTILTNTNHSMQVCSDEIFGPVVTLEPYEDFDEAIALLNNTRFGLQAGVFTNNMDEMNRAFESIVAGGIIMNDVPTFRVDHMPYGGVKDSGIGREGVKYAMLDMLEPRILVKSF